MELITTINTLGKIKIGGINAGKTINRLASLPATVAKTTPFQYVKTLPDEYFTD